MKKVRVHMRVYGRVQGVFFRANMRERAVRLGLKGWVRNLPDGSVEAIVEGDEEDVEGLVRWAARGPPLAHVERLEMKREEYKGEFKDFEIIYF